MSTSYVFKPNKFSSHMKIIKYLLEQNKRLKILDVGCSKGFMGQQLNKQHDFYGIEMDEQDAKYARKYYKEVKVLDIENDSLSYKKESFDVIITADVIEHLKNPSSCVKKLSSLLKKGGIFIISVPNIANFWIRMQLLFGNFNYQERGIMDRTHLKFFTLKTIRKLIRESNLKIEKEDATTIPFDQMNSIFAKAPLKSIHQVYYSFVSLRRPLFAFQFILYCRKRN